MFELWNFLFLSLQPKARKRYKGKAHEQKTEQLQELKLNQQNNRRRMTAWICLSLKKTIR